MKKTIVALTAVALTAVLAWWLLQGTDKHGTGSDGAAETTGELDQAETSAPKPGAEAGRSRAGNRAPALPEVFRDDDPKGPLQLEGQVLGADELPIAGARVTLDSNPPRTLTSEEDGSFAFDELVPRTYALRAHKDDLVGGPVMHELTASSHPVAVRMAPGGAVKILVVDGDDRPVAGAEVELRDGGDSRRVSTDSAGSAEFRGVARGFVNLVASASGFAVTRKLVQIPGKAGVTIETRLVMKKGGPVAGRVVDEDGKAIAGARVVAQNASQVITGSNVRQDGVDTDASGRFKMPALAAGTYRFVAIHGEHAPGTSDLISLDGVTARDDIVIELAAGGLLSGRVVDSSGSPVPFAAVRVASKNLGFGGFAPGAGSSREATSDGDGEFTIAGLQRAELRVVARSEQASSEVVDVDLRTSRAHRGLVLTLSVGGVIAGVVVDSAGEPVPEAQVTAIPDFIQGASVEDFALRGTAGETTDGGGRFALRGLPDGTYRVRASRTGVSLSQFFQPGVQATTGTEDLRLVVEDPGAIAGTLAIDDGTIPVAFTVTVGFPPGVPVSNRSGAFQVDQLPPGTYDVTLRGVAFASRTVRDVVVEAGKTTDMGAVTAVRGRQVNGRVIDRDGGPVAGATVILARQLLGNGASMQTDLSEATTELFGVRRAVSGQDGSYRITGVGKGEVQIIAEHTEKGRSEPAVVPGGTDDMTYELTLQPFGSVAGTVTAGGAPTAATIMASSKSGGSQVLIVQAGEDGTFMFERLPEGSHRINATLAGDGVGSTKMAGADVQVVAGERASVDIAIEVGDINLEVVIAGVDGAQIDAAQVFLFKGKVAPTNGKEVGEVFTKMSQSGNAMIGMSLGGKPAVLAGVAPAEHSVCVLPINGDLNDPDFAMRLQKNAQHLAVHCESKVVAPSPVKQSHTAVVPPMNPLPNTEL